MTRSFDSVRRIEGRIGKGLLHKITLDGTTTSLLAVGSDEEMGIGATQFIPPIDLVLIQCETRHVGSGKFANVPHGSADAASYIQHFDICHGGSTITATDGTTALVSIPIRHSIIDGTAHNLSQHPAQIQFTRQIKLMPPSGFIERFVRMTIRKMKGGSPSPFVKEGG
jgi:hypothetical protein